MSRADLAAAAASLRALAGLVESGQVEGDDCQLLALLTAASVLESAGS